MTWFDELDESTQQQWRTRIAKGRIDLSASVEETLADPSAKEDLWLDEYDEVDEVEVDGMNVVDAQVGNVSARTAIIPPRLSLQTKPMTVIATASPLTAQRTNIPPPVAESQMPAQAGQHTNVFARLAQRLTSSLAAITTPFQESVPEPPMPVRANTPLAPHHDVGIQSVTTVRVERSETTTTTIIGASPVPYVAPLALPAPEVQSPQSKSRPAGYPTKVHLQAAPRGTSSRPTVNGSASEYTAYAPHEDTEPLAMRKTPRSPRSAPTTIELPNALSAQSSNEIAAMHSAGEPSMTGQHISDITTSGRLAAVHPPQKKTEEQERTRETRETRQTGEAGEARETGPVVAATQVGPTGQQAQLDASFGSGAFEPGQEDLVIANSRITSASVVNVMLSSEPGPVVVQYVSLRPGTGFTIHLSAAAKMKTTFNYVAFQGEA